LKESGIGLAFTTEFGPVPSAPADVYALPRIAIFPGTQVDQFARVVTRASDSACPSGDAVTKNKGPAESAGS